MPSFLVFMLSRYKKEPVSWSAYPPASGVYLYVPPRRPYPYSGTRELHQFLSRLARWPQPYHNSPQEVRIRTVTWWLSSAWFVGNWLVINTGSSHVPCNCFKVMAIIRYMHTLSYSSSLQNIQSQPNFLWKFLVVLDTDTSHLPTESCHHYDASSRTIHPFPFTLSVYHELHAPLA